MTTFFPMHKKTLALVIVLAGMLMSSAIMQIQAAANDASITLKKDTGTGLFTLTIKDPDGIQEFSMMPAGKLPYGGGLSGCPATFSITNTSFDASSDFEPAMKAYVLDCQNNTANLEIAPPKDGLAKSKSLVKEEPPPPPPPAPAEKPAEEKKGGPLSASDIVYPVKELGNCQSDSECRSYCDNADRAKACFTFAKKYHLISEEEAEEAADKFLNVKNGPGGCNSGSSCETYCNSVDHLDACIAFAEETGYYSPEELAEARKFQALVKTGTQFPGGCKDRNTCEIYCSDSGHMEECLNFAEKSGFMPKNEIDEARKFMALMRQGESPGGCTSKEQCENYCFEESHIDECIAFAEKAGVMTAEEAIMARKVGGKGPGGCRSKVQCETYCEANSEECFNFAQEHGLISEDDLAEMREGMARFREELDKMPPEAVQCMKDAAGEENFNKMIAGEPVFDRGIEGKMKSCFVETTAQFIQQLSNLPPEAAQCIRDAIGEEGFEKLQNGEFDENFDFEPLEVCFQKLQGSFGGGSNFSGGGFSGPGGCKNTQECTAYCQEHLDECKGFGPPGGGGGGGFSGPGGCTNSEECRAYCKEHFDECKNFSPPGGGGFPGGGATGGQFPGSGATGGSFPGGPGGCTSKEECQAYCQEHLDECKNFAPPSNVGGGSSEAQQTGQQPIQGSAIAQSCVLPDGVVNWLGLVSSWKGDIVSGKAVDSVGRNDGTLYTDTRNASVLNAVTSVPGKIGNAFKLNLGGYISMGNPVSLNFGTGGGTFTSSNPGLGFSLEAWFKWDNSETGLVVLLGKMQSGPGYRLRIYPDENQQNQLEFSAGTDVRTDGTFYETVKAPVNPGEWYHVVATSKLIEKNALDDVVIGSHMLKLYLNGELKGAVRVNTPSVTSNAPFVLGAWHDQYGVGYPGAFFAGLIDEVYVYNRALDEREVRHIFSLGSGSEGKCARAYREQLPDWGEDWGAPTPSPQPSPSVVPVIPNYPSTSAGPGGCTGPEECQTYCMANYQNPACQQYAPSSTEPPPVPATNYSGPGGCKTTEECTTYCTQNYQDPACQQFSPGSQAEPLNQGFFARVLSAFGPILGIR